MVAYVLSFLFPFFCVGLSICNIIWRRDELNQQQKKLDSKNTRKRFVALSSCLRLWQIAIHLRSAKMAAGVDWEGETKIILARADKAPLCDNSLLVLAHRLESVLCPRKFYEPRHRCVWKTLAHELLTQTESLRKRGTLWFVLSFTIICNEDLKKHEISKTTCNKNSDTIFIMRDVIQSLMVVILTLKN